jgi:type I restriction enzyme S subunit
MSSWKTIKLDEWVKAGSIELGRGNIISKDDINKYHGAYPIYSSSAHNNGKFGEYAKFMFDEELITWSVDGGGNFFYRPKHKFSVTNVCGFMRVKSEKLNAPFIYYCLTNQHKSLTFDYTTKAHPSVIRKLYWLPKIDANIQKKISSILLTIDQTIEKTEALIEKYQQIKAGLMHDLFTRGIGADGKLRPPREQAPELYQQTPIGWIPKDWQYALLDNLAKRGSGHTPNKNIPSYWNGGVKWVSLSDSRNLDNLHISDTDLEISHLGIENSSAVLHPAGTVIMTRDAGVGKSAIITESMAVSQHFMAWRCGDKIDNYFLYYWLQLNKRTFENVAMGSTIVTIGLPYFKKLKLAAPVSIDEQNEIGRRLKTIDSYIQSHKTDSEKLKQQKSGLMHDLLTGKVQVPINSTEAAHV